tara:strand:- start:1745 stop:2029 length:285 start_codon:yes stop_codon:yes gene_type:complete
MAIRTEQDQLLNEIKLNTLAAIQPTSSIIIDDTDEHTGPYFAITALTDSVIDSSECTTNITDVPATLTIPVGVTIYGNFTSIELDSGTVIAYTK